MADGTGTTCHVFIVDHLIFYFDFSLARSTEVLFLYNFLCACAVLVFHDCAFEEM